MMSMLNSLSTENLQIKVLSIFIKVIYRQLRDVISSYTLKSAPQICTHIGS